MHRQAAFQPTDQQRQTDGQRQIQRRHGEPQFEGHEGIGDQVTTLGGQVGHRDHAD